MPDPRDQRCVIHDQRSTLAQRVNAIALGYEDLNEHETQRVYPALHSVNEKEPGEDADATDDAVHGIQVGRFFHGYYDLVNYLRQHKLDIRVSPYELIVGSAAGDACAGEIIP